MPDLSINSLKANLTNPQRAYMWDVVFPDVRAGDTLLLRAQSTTLPGRSVGNIEVPYKGAPSIQYAGKLDYSHDWTCEFIESEDRQTFQTFYNMAQNVMDDVTNVGVGDTNYKQNIFLRLLSTKGEITNGIELVGAYISKINDVALSYDGSNVVKFSVTFRYDSWTQN